MEMQNTSNIQVSDIDKYIEQNIEKKINQLLDTLPQTHTQNDIKMPKMIQEYTVGELYTGTIQTVIEIINEFTALNADRKYLSSKDYFKKLFDIFLKNDRKIFVGIVLVILSFILYFIDGADV